MKNANNIYSNPKKILKKKPQLKLLHRATYCQLSPPSRIQSREWKANNIRGITIFSHPHPALPRLDFPLPTKMVRQEQLRLFSPAPLYISVKRINLYFQVFKSRKSVSQAEIFRSGTFTGTGTLSFRTRFNTGHTRAISAVPR